MIKKKKNIDETEEDNEVHIIYHSYQYNDYSLLYLKYKQYKFKLIIHAQNNQESYIYKDIKLYQVTDNSLIELINGYADLCHKHSLYRAEVLDDYETKFNIKQAYRHIIEDIFEFIRSVY